MAYDEVLASRIRALVATDLMVSERKMFGGLCFMRGGNMCFGVIGGDLMVRVGPDAYASALRLPNAREMNFTGRSMRGMVYVSSAGTRDDDDLDEWLHRGLSYAASLPPKGPKAGPTF